MEVEYPEVLLARRIVRKYNISIPFDLDKIVKKYAVLIYKAIPIDGVDGVSLNIKTPGKTPTVIVNTNFPLTRQRFTLAHELGHLIIPWHLGTIVDDIYSESYKSFAYQDIEQEANRFAAEILMPQQWVKDLIQNNTNTLAQLHKYIARQAGVSEHAAVIRLINYLPKNIIYVAEEFGRVKHTAKSHKTNALLQMYGHSFDSEFYSYIKEESISIAGTTTYHWYELESKVKISIDDSRNWREIQDKIISDIQLSEEIDYFKNSINGIIGYAHGIAKKEEDYCVETVVSICIQRFKRKGYEEFLAHPEFKIFLSNRVKDFFK